MFVYDGGGWTESVINDMDVTVTYTAQSNAGIDAAVDFMYLKVKYYEPVDTYDSTVNNAHITSGNVSISRGNISI